MLDPLDERLHADYTYNTAAYHCTAMKSEYLEEDSWQVRRRFNTIGSIVRRAFGMVRSQRSLRNLPLFLLANAIAHREVHRKNRMRLGIMRSDMSSAGRKVHCNVTARSFG